MLSNTNRTESLTKFDLDGLGRGLVMHWLRLQGWGPIIFGGDVPGGESCGLYEAPGTIYVTPRSCSSLGRSGACWSWPGYIIDRTPYGVYAHELGHHVDARRRWSLSRRLRKFTGELPISGYCPDDQEWFAEIFRLYMTNPDLLQRIRPYTYDYLRKDFAVVEGRTWRAVLKGAPPRTLAMAERRIRESDPKWRAARR